MRKLNLLLFLMLFVGTIYAQNKNAAFDQVIVYEPELISKTLPKEVNEQSGMVWYKNLIWIINDSYCPSKIYAYNKKGELKSQIKIKNQKNIDWEDLTDDDKYIYIGDFGNNFGVRKNLRVLRVSKSVIQKEKNIEKNVEVIKFKWADQQDFSLKKHRNDYDCEAFLSYGDSLYFFTKNWANKKTRMYVMAKSSSQNDLLPKATFNANLLVTGADLSSDGKVLALVGYKNFHSYLLLFYDFEGTNFFSGKKIRLDLESLGRAQTEGVVFDEDDNLFISTEETRDPQSLYHVDWRKFIF